MDILKDFLVALPIWARIIAYIIGIIIWTWFIFFYPGLKQKSIPTMPQQNMPAAIGTKIEEIAGDYVAGNKNVFNIETKKNDSIIRSLELRVAMDMFVPDGENIVEGTSVGLTNVVGLFSLDKTRYRFISDYKFLISKIEPDKQRLTLVYQPETPDQIMGKKIDFLRDMKILAINYSDFLKTIKLKIDQDKPIIFNVDVILNGVKVISISNNVLASTICNGQASMEIGKYFQDVDKIYHEISSK